MERHAWHKHIILSLTYNRTLRWRHREKYLINIQSLICFTWNQLIITSSQASKWHFSEKSIFAKQINSVYIYIYLLWNYPFTSGAPTAGVSVARLTTVIKMCRGSVGPLERTQGSATRPNLHWSGKDFAW
jgi:hypothetical protein